MAADRETQWRRTAPSTQRPVYDLKTFKPVACDIRSGIRQLLEGMQRFGWQPVREGENIIGLKGMGAQNGASISLEPGGQFELSGAALKTVHETCAEVNTHLEQTREVANEIGAGVLGFGFAPSWTLAETPVMPKGRYKIMRDYMPKVGGYGLDMMFRTRTVRDESAISNSEAGMVKKFSRRIGAAAHLHRVVLPTRRSGEWSGPAAFPSRRAPVWTDVRAMPALAPELPWAAPKQTAWPSRALCRLRAGRADALLSGSRLAIIYRHGRQELPGKSPGARSPKSPTSRPC